MGSMRTKVCIPFLKRVIFWALYRSRKSYERVFSVGGAGGRDEDVVGCLLVENAPIAFDHTKSLCRVCANVANGSIAARAVGRKSRKMHYHLMNLLAIPAIDFLFRIFSFHSAQ